MEFLKIKLMLKPRTKRTLRIRQSGGDRQVTFHFDTLLEILHDERSLPDRAHATES